MISDQLKDTIVDQIIKGLIGEGTEGIKPVLELLLNTAMNLKTAVNPIFSSVTRLLATA